MTVKPVVPRERAVHDVDDAIDFYLSEGAARAATDLIDALQSTYRLIGAHPGIGSPRYGHELDIPGLRGRAPERFPYVVLCIEHTTHVDVLRVLHQHRDIPETFSNLDQV